MFLSRFLRKTALAMGGILSIPLSIGTSATTVADTDVPVMIVLGQSNADGSAYFDADLDAQLNEWYSSSANPGKMKIWYRSTQVENQTSNALGEAARWVVDGTTTDVAPGWLNLWYRNENTQGRTAMNMIHNFGSYSTGTDTNCAQGRRGMEGAFGKAFQTAFPESELYILKLGASGSFISAWANPQDDTNWNYFYEKIFKPAMLDLIAKGKRPRLAGVWWMQGCADRNATQQYYQTCLKRLVDRIESELGFPGGKVYIGHIPTNSVQYGVNVRNAQDAVAASDENVETVDTDNFELQYESAFNGTLHFNHAGVNAIGKELANRIATSGAESWAVYSTPGKWRQNGTTATFTPTFGEPEISYATDGDVVTATLTYPGFTETKTYTLQDESEKTYLGPGYLDCDGTRYMRIPNSTDFDIASDGSMTISFNMYVPQWPASGNYYGFVCNNSRNSSLRRTGFDICMGAGSSMTLGNNFSLHNGTNNGANIGGAWINSGYTPGNWAHVVWTYDGSTRWSRIYIDGQLKREKQATSTQVGPCPSQSDILVGARWLLNDEPTTSITYILNGKISDLRFYREALTSAEVTADAEGAVEGKTLIAAYDFRDINGLTVTDITGNGHDATLVGFPEYVDGATVTVEQATGGTVDVLKEGEAIVNGTKIAEGTTLTVSATAYVGYTLESITVNGNPIEGNTFVMGSEDVTVSAVFGHDASAPTKVLVFGMNENGSKFYRIPAICCTPTGTLIAVADKRGSSISDLPNTISIVMKRSTDNGDTWSEAVTLAQGNSSTNETYGDPAIVCDRETGTIICVFVGDTGFMTSLNGSKKQGLYYVKSTDDGLTWTEPVKFNDSVWQSSWYAAFIASGAGFQDESGRIMFVANARTNQQSNTSGVYEYLIYTDDLGETWHVANPNSLVPEGGYGNESKVVELSNGDLLMSMRYGTQRRFMKSSDRGVTWGSPYNVPQLVEPSSGSGCNGDIIRYPSADGQTRLLHSSAASLEERRDVSVFLSYDEGETWPVKKRLIDGRSAYSALTVLKDGSIGCFVEDGWGQIGDMTSTDGFNLYFMRFTLDWLTDGADAPEQPGEKSPGYLACDGTRYMFIPNNDAFTIPANGNFTVSFRVKLNSWAQSGKFYGLVTNNFRNSSLWRSGFELFSGSSSSQTLGLNVSPNNSASNDVTNFGGAFITSGVTIGEWAHVAWTYNGTTGASKVYINGSALRETTNSNRSYPITSQDNILVGTRYTMPPTAMSEIDVNAMLDGDIDDLRFYSDALSAAEVAADAEGVVEGKTLIAAYDFTDIEGNNVPDISGNGHDGVLVGFPDYTTGGSNTLLVTIEAPQANKGTLRVFNGDTEMFSGRRVAEGTELTIEAEGLSPYITGSIYVNGEALPEGTNTVTVAEDIVISADFVRDPSLPVNYVEPKGGATSQANCYVATASTSGAMEDINITRTGKNGTYYELCDDQAIKVKQGQQFSLRLQGKVTSTNTSVAPSPQDLRYCVVFVFTDWDRDGSFEQETPTDSRFSNQGYYGYWKDHTGFSPTKANYDYSLDITHTFNVPETAELGVSRIRVIYTEAWDQNVPNGNVTGNYQSIDKGYSYDYLVDCNDKTAGIDDIVADDDNAPTEYYTIHGIRAYGELQPGVYIKRQGSKVSKVVVK